MWRCSSEPKESIIHAHMLWMVRYAVVDVSAAASASKMMEPSLRDNPVPPTSGDTKTPANPSAAAARNASSGKCFLSSHSAAWGSKSLAAKPWARSR